jgi:CCR4-NOT complex subunit CAF16
MSVVDTKNLAPSIDVKDLSYAFPDGSSGLKEVFLQLPPGSRTLLIGGMRCDPYSRWHGN